MFKHSYFCISIQFNVSKDEYLVQTDIESYVQDSKILGQSDIVITNQHFYKR